MSFHQSTPSRTSLVPLEIQNVENSEWMSILRGSVKHFATLSSVSMQRCYGGNITFARGSSSATHRSPAIKAYFKWDSIGIQMQNDNWYVISMHEVDTNCINCLSHKAHRNRRSYKQLGADDFIANTCTIVAKSPKGTEANPEETHFHFEYHFSNNAIGFVAVFHFWVVTV